MGIISLPPEIDRANRTPRVATAIDTTSGVKTKPSLNRKVCIVGQMLSTGIALPATPTPLYRETDSETYFGVNSAIDFAAKAAFLANPTVDLTAIGVLDAGGATAATGLLTFLGTATSNGLYVFNIAGKPVRIVVNTGDTASVIGATAVAAINAMNLPVTSSTSTGNVTLTARNKGPIGNNIAMSGYWETTPGVTTATITGTALSGGAGVPPLSTTFAALASQRYNVICVLFDDYVSGVAAQAHIESQGDAEHGKGEIAIQVINGSLSTATSLALGLNGLRNQVVAVGGSESWSMEICGAYCAVEASNTDPALPRNRQVLKGILPPPLAKRWIPTELKTLINSGCTPLNTIPGEKLAITRAVVTHVTNAASNPDYSLLDVNKIISLDYVRDAVNLMFNTNYGAAKWADDDPTGNYPSDVATPSKVRDDLIDIARQAQRDGILENVESYIQEFAVEKVDDQCVFSMPADVIEGMHLKFGKIVYFNRPLV